MSNIMRFKISIRINKHISGNRLPLNYAYELQSVIYKIFAGADAEFSEWLHNNGYSANKKKFKLFTFSRLHIPQYKIDGSFLHILSDNVVWYVSFLPERSTNEFIKGVFSQQEFDLGNRQCRVRCCIESVEMVSTPMYAETMHFSLLSPICITLKRSDGSNEYISPSHPNAEKLILTNLLDKYLAINNKEYPDRDFPFSLKIKTTPKSTRTTIKAGTPKESKLRGYMCDFQLTAPQELMKIMYEGGIGGKNSMGFGMCEVMEK